MTKYADTVPSADREFILDMYYGRGNFKGLKIVYTTHDMSRIMKGKYTKAQIRSVILDDMAKNEGGAEL